MEKPAQISPSQWWLPASVAIAGCLLSVGVAWLDSRFLTLTFFGTMASLCLGLLLMRSRENRSRDPTLLETPFFLAHDAEVFKRYRAISHQMVRVSGRVEPNYRKSAMRELDVAVEKLTEIGDGKIVFQGTEAWRLVYEQLLRDPSVLVYRSVALVKNTSYWQDGAGLQSMQLNFDLIARSVVTIERTVIVTNELWPPDDELPTEMLRQWIHEQSVNGVFIRLVRKSDLLDEPELLRDIGIYGFTATGTQEFDDSDRRTSKFTLDFDFDSVRAAEANWNRLNVYATPYAEILDRFSLGE
ncbi:hypothetical protein [Planctomycetes bacterium K23_9]|uniref:Uncharacterized protein n=1 Tax=Stieleria marina TaxID=1930275 RepID=A0A517P202_9BACT|nr:hypothetical protein K239x_54180 [Planctomycetes bacterium K23_9]